MIRLRREGTSEQFLIRFTTFMPRKIRMYENRVLTLVTTKKEEEVTKGVKRIWVLVLLPVLIFVPWSCNG